MDIEVSEVAKVCVGIILRKITHDPISILATIITLSQTLQILNWADTKCVHGVSSVPLIFATYLPQIMYSLS